MVTILPNSCLGMNDDPSSTKGRTNNNWWRDGNGVCNFWYLGTQHNK